MKVFIVGAGGHSRVVYEILSYNRNFEVVGFTDNVMKEPDEKIFGKPIIGKHSIWPKLYKEGLRHTIVAIGDNHIRKQRFDDLLNQDFEMINAIHPSARISPSVRMGKGNVVGPGAIINTNARIGEDCIINSGAVVEHECRIDDHVHIAPRSCIAGRTNIGELTFVGMGSVVKEYLTIGRNVTIGAGSVVLKDFPNDVLVAGVPAVIKKRKKYVRDEEINLI